MMKKYWYTLMLVGSLVAVKVGALISQGAGLETLLKQNSQQELLTESETPPMDLPISLNGGSEFPSSGGNSPALSKESEEDSKHETSTDVPTAGLPSEHAADSETHDSFTAVPKDNTSSPLPAEDTSAAKNTSSDSSAPIDFSSTLFIGDSRTEGLKEYGGLNEAEFFANSGMSTFNLLSASLTLKDGSKKTLEELLSERSYERIYLMLGINELGYPSSTVIRQYSAIVDRIQALQPNARLVLEANLHVTKKKSDSDPTYGNGKLNALNNAIYQIAVDKGCGYVDVNGLFDDGQGNLDSKYSVDNAHIMGKYYTVWAQWLRTQHV